MSATDLPEITVMPTAGAIFPAPDKGVEPNVQDLEEGQLPTESNVGEPPTDPPSAPPNSGNIQPAVEDNPNTTNAQEQVGDHPNPAPSCEGPPPAIPKRSLTEIVAVRQVKRVARHEYEFLVQWFQKEEDSWEKEETIRDATRLVEFWKLFKGKKNAVKIGDSLIAPEEKIRHWEDDFLSSMMMIESVGPDGNEAGADSSQANPGQMEPHFIVYIKAAKVDKGDLNYRVRWFQYDEDKDLEWVPEKNMRATELVKRFWEDVGVPRESFNGQSIECSAEFIAQCKRHFLRHPTML